MEFSWAGHLVLGLSKPSYEIQSQNSNILFFFEINYCRGVPHNLLLLKTDKSIYNIYNKNKRTQLESNYLQQVVNP
jgi:hypothetical protein